MSPDPFAALADTLSDFALGLRGLPGANRRPAPGSPADKEAGREDLAGEWGDHPSRDILASVTLTAWSSADHLAATADVIRARRVVAPPYTLVRAACEAAAISCYLSEPGIDRLERVRRNMNWRLDGLCQQVVMMTRFTGPEAAEQMAAKEARIEAIGRTGQLHGLPFRERHHHRSAYLGEPPPAAIWLIDQCTSRTAGLGKTYQQLLSGVAHAKYHGLSQFLRSHPPLESDQPGQVLIQADIGSAELAQHLLPGPLCASTLVEHLRWFAGWDAADLGPLVIRMLRTWVDIAGVPDAWAGER